MRGKFSPSLSNHLVGRTHNQFFRAHQRVKIKNTARTKQATLLAFVSNPQAIRHAPMKEEPR